MLYNYNLWYDNNIIHSGNGYDSEDEAIFEAKVKIDHIIDKWKIDDTYSGETPDDFEIDICKYNEEDEDEDTADFQNDLEYKYINK